MIARNQKSLGAALPDRRNLSLESLLGIDPLRVSYRRNPPGVDVVAQEDDETGDTIERVRLPSEFLEHRLVLVFRTARITDEEERELHAVFGCGRRRN